MDSLGKIGIGAGVVAGAAWGYAKHFRLTGPALATAMTVSKVAGVIAAVAFVLWTLSSLYTMYRTWSNKPTTTTDDASDKMQKAPDGQGTVPPAQTNAPLSATPPAPEPTTTGPTSSDPHTSEKRPTQPSSIPPGKTSFSLEAEIFQYGVNRNATAQPRSLDDTDKARTNQPLAPISLPTKKLTTNPTNIPPCEARTPTETPELQRSSGGALESSTTPTVSSESTSSSSTSSSTTTAPASSSEPLPATIPVPSSNSVANTDSTTTSTTLSTETQTESTSVSTHTQPPAASAEPEASNAPAAPAAPIAPEAPGAPSAPEISDAPLDLPKKTGTCRRKRKSKSGSSIKGSANTPPPKQTNKSSQAGGFDPNAVLNVKLKKNQSQQLPKSQKTSESNSVVAALSKLKKTPTKTPAANQKNNG